MTRYLFLLLFFMLILTGSQPAYASGPGKGSLNKGTIEVDNTHATCILHDVTVKWSLNSLMGENTIFGTYQFMSHECPIWKDFSKVTVFLKLEYGDGYGWVSLYALKPTGPGQWAFDTTAHSKNWAKTICGYKGAYPTDKCLSKQSAIAIWKHGSVTDFSIGAN